jgi:hypothetical protein
VLVGGRVAIVHQGEVDAYPVREPKQLEVPVEPPARVLLPEHDQQERRQDENSAGADHDRLAVLGSAVALRVTLDGRRDDQDRNRDDYPEGRRQPVELAIRVFDRELHRVRLSGSLAGRLHSIPMMTRSALGG